MFRISTTLWVCLFFGLLLLSACNLPGTAPATQENPDLIYTAAAQTVAARLTDSASGSFPTPIVSTPVPNVQATATQGIVVATSTQAVAPTATSAPPTSAPATSTSNPATATPIPCDRASFVKDVTYADGAEVVAGTTFVKTWRLRNTGSCTWNSSYALVFVSGDAMNGPAAIQLTTGNVAPNQEIDVSVTLKAPDSPKEYTGNWKLRNGQNMTYGIGANAQASFWVKIKVVSPVTPTPTATQTPTANVVYNFLEKASGAEWRNGTKLLPWGDPSDDTAGVASYVDNAKLNDGKTYTRVLATYPERIENGVITGQFSPYIVQNGDHFTARLGFKSGCDNGRVKFQLNYVEGGVTIALREWSKTCDSNLLPVDVDLSTLNGKTVAFMLAVITDGAPDGDFAVWVDPRIQR